jgi:hypothetical protein
MTQDKTMSITNSKHIKLSAKQISKIINKAEPSIVILGSTPFTIETFDIALVHLFTHEVNKRYSNISVKECDQLLTKVKPSINARAKTLLNKFIINNVVQNNGRPH